MDSDRCPDATGARQPRRCVVKPGRLASPLFRIGNVSSASTMAEWACEQAWTQSKTLPVTFVCGNALQTNGLSMHQGMLPRHRNLSGLDASHSTGKALQAVWSDTRSDNVRRWDATRVFGSNLKCVLVMEKHVVMAVGRVVAWCGTTLAKFRSAFVCARGPTSSVRPTSEHRLRHRRRNGQP